MPNWSAIRISIECVCMSVNLPSSSQTHHPPHSWPCDLWAPTYHLRPLGANRSHHSWATSMNCKNVFPFYLVLNWGWPKRTHFSWSFANCVSPTGHCCSWCHVYNSSVLITLVTVPCRLSHCSFTQACGGDLAEVLRESQTLIELDLAWNEIEDKGVELLCEGLKHPDCKLEILE